MGTADKIPILFLCDEIKQATAGSEQHLSFLLKNLPRDRFDVHFALLRGDKRLPPEFSPIQPTILNLHSFKNPLEVFRVLRALRRLVRQRSIKILHAFFRDSEFLSAIAGLDSMGCRRVVARRSMGYDDTFVFRLRNRLAAKFEGSYAVNSEAIKHHLISSERIPPERITVIYNPINQERLAEGMAAPLERKRWGLAEGDLVVGIVANIRPVKDYETFFKAAILVAERVPNAKFLVLGSKDGDYWERLRPLAECTELNNRLVLIGPVSNPFPVVRLFDVGVLSSISEGFSNSLIEYAAAGIPTVATDVGGNREIVEDGKTGYLVLSRSPELLASKIINLLLNEEKRKEFGQKARESAYANFYQEIILSRYQEFYQEQVMRHEAGKIGR
jgi:glycosyltransferase involved in cell wall biosynthesis